MSKGKDIEAAKKLKEQIDKNLKMDEQGKINPEFADLSNPINDPFSPIGKTPDELAMITTNKVPNPSSSTSSSQVALQSKQEIQDLVNNMAGAVGYLLTPTHLEDLYAIAKHRILTDESVWMYLRGAMRSSQIFVMNLDKVVKTLENVVSKSQNSLMIVADANKQVTEKLSLLSVKVDSVTPSITNLVTTEFKANRVQLNSIKTAITALTPLSVSSSSATVKDLYPGTKELILLFQAGKFSPNIIGGLVERYIGKVTWAEYEQIVTGKMLPEVIRETVKGWKDSKK